MIITDIPIVIRLTGIVELAYRLHKNAAFTLTRKIWWSTMDALRLLLENAEA